MRKTIAERFEEKFRETAPDWYGVSGPQMYRRPWHHDHISWEWWWRDEAGNQYRLFSFNSLTKCVRHGFETDELKPDPSLRCTDIEVSADV